jgi:hypothetical protein
MKTYYHFLAISLLGMASSHAAVTLYAEYRLGETGSLGAGNRPLDSSGNGKNMANEISGATTSTGTAGVSAPGSTHYLDTAASGDQGWYSSNLYNSAPPLALDNFAFGIYARAAANTAATRGDVFTIGGSNGSFKLSLGSNGWAASAHNVAWIGSSEGTPGSFTANEWAHIAMIRSGGTTTFYINGIAQAGTSTSTPVIDTPHFSVNPGGSIYFDGHLDEARVVTFTSGESTANILNTLAVPEPSSALLGSLGMLALLRRRR